jgi:predicted aspartyl protease
MARLYRFDRPTPYDLITVSGYIQWANSLTYVRLAIDTGATHSVLDANVLYAKGWKASPKKPDTKVRTASGVIDGYLVHLPQIQVLGETRDNLSVFVFDFLSVGSAENYDGLLGLDFFETVELCISLTTNELRVRSAHIQV